MSAPHLSLRGLSKTFELGERTLTVLDDVSLQVDRGEFVAIVGPSGTGKSTLLNMIAGIDQPTRGEVWVGDTPVHPLDENALAVWRGRQVGVVFQFFQLLPALTLLQNVILPMDFDARVPARVRADRAMALLERVGVADQADKRPGTVSGGQQQRAAIARALANDPPLIVADEPTGNLDTRTAEDVLRVFETLRDEARTIVMVTHAPAIAARADRVVEVIDGRIAANAPSTSRLALAR